MLSLKNWETDVSEKVGRKKDITRGTVLAGAASYDRGREVGGSKHDLLQTSLHGEYHDDRYHHCHPGHPDCQTKTSYRDNKVPALGDGNARAHDPPAMTNGFFNGYPDQVII